MHESIGVLGAVSVATACVLPGSIAADMAQVQRRGEELQVDVEHPTGFFTVNLQLDVNDGAVTVRRSALLRTARKLMSGEVFVPHSVWPG